MHPVITSTEQEAALVASQYFHVIAMSEDAVAMEVQSRVAEGGHETAAGDRLNLGLKLEQQGVGRRVVAQGDRRRSLNITEIFATPLLKQKRLVHEAGDARLNQRLDRKIALLAQLRVHRGSYSRKPWRANVPSA